MFIHEFTLIGQNAWSEVYLFSTIEEDLEGKRKLMPIIWRLTWLSGRE